MGVGSMRGQRQDATVGSRASGTAPLGGNRVLWRGRHASLLSGVKLASKQLRGSGRMLLAVGVGILVAVVLICAVPLYSSLVSNIQLQATINARGPIGRNVEIQASSAKFTDALRQQEDGRVRADAGRYLGAFAAPGVTNYLTADSMLLGAVNTQLFPPSAPNAPQVQLEAFDYSQAQSHMRLAPGSALPKGSDSPPYDALVTQDMASSLGVKVGDRIVAVEFGEHTRQIATRVVGIWSPANPQDAYWNGRVFTSGGDTPVYPVLLDANALTQAMANLPDVTVTQHWVYYTNASHITTANMNGLLSDVGQLKAHLSADVTSLGATVVVIQGLEQTIHDVQNQLALLGLPLYIVVGQIVGLALLFVAAMAGLLVDAQTGEIATLKSRGASGAQLLGSYAAQGLLLGAVAVVLGPFLAAALAIALIRWFVPASTVSAAGATPTYLTQLAAPAMALVPAVAGALLGAGAVVVAAQRAARLDVLAFRREQGRATRQPFWRRYYLDLVLVIICVLGYLELGQFGGLQTRQTLGQGASSPLLLAAPALLLLAGALVLLRLFPLASEGGARLATRGRGATGVLAFAQVARSPAGPSRLGLLLALGVGLALFAVTFDASLVRNGTDRAAYQVGADLRLSQAFSELPSSDARIQKALASQPGVLGVTSAYRNSASTTSEEGLSTVELLAIDPATWGRVAGATSWRGDYADTSLDQIMAGLRAHQQGESAADRAGQTGAGSSGHRVWAVVSQTFASNLSVKVGDSFALAMPDSVGTPSFFIVGAIVQDFPTLYPAHAPGGFLVAGLNDMLGAMAVASQGGSTQKGPNEYWLKTSDDPTQLAALNQFLAQNAVNGEHLDISRVYGRRALAQSIESNPVQSGMRGLLTVGALIAAALAVLGTIVHSALAARQRVVQFAVLRTLGMRNRQLTGLLLGEQVVIYAFGLLGGTVLGFVLVSATLPYLQFSDTTIDPTSLGVPPYLLAFDAGKMLAFFAILLVAFAIALLIAARFAATVGLGKTLRLGED